MKIVLLWSGGLDSTTALFQLRAEGHEVKGLAINYGQRHRKELDVVRRLGKDLNLDYRIVDLSGARELFAGSSQTSDIEVPEGHYQSESMKITVVPNRNMVMLSLATSWALSLGYGGVGYAAHAGDHTIYPDCRPKFVASMKSAIHLCDWNKIELLTPFLKLTKSEIVKRAVQLNVPLEWTWSCYKGLEHHCGKCGTCVERKEAFQLAGVVDPTLYGGEI